MADRIDDLRKRVAKDPESRLFAQLAEELRKGGEFEEAIRVARDGLRRHANYPSARMTLGRALFDTGDWAAARAEFEQVLKGAPDNILASRLLAECLESGGDRAGALARYKTTLALAPGDKQILAKMKDLESPGAAPARPTPGAPPPAPAPRPAARVSPPPMPGPAAGVAATRPPAPPPPGVAAALRKVEPPPLPPPITAQPPPPPEPPPIPVATVEGEMEIETTQAAAAAALAPPPAAPPGDAGQTSPGAAPASDEPAPIPVAAADESFELERTYEPPARTEPPPPPPAPPAPPRAAPSPMLEMDFEGEDPLPATLAPMAAPPPLEIRPLEVEPEVVPEPAPPVTAAAAVAPPRPEPASPVAPPLPPPAPPAPTAPPVAVAPAAELVSPTLAELYFNQGFTDKAIEVYRQLAERDPGNPRLAERLAELQAAPVAASPAAPPAAEPAPRPSDPDTTRRQALERTIARLERLRDAVRRG